MHFLDQCSLSNIKISSIIPEILYKIKLIVQCTCRLEVIEIKKSKL